MPFDCRHQYAYGHDACVADCPTRHPTSGFIYQRVNTHDDAPMAEEGTVEVAILDMNHGWPNLGHAAVVRSLRQVVCDLREALSEAGLRVRVSSYDVRRHGGTPDVHDRDGLLCIGTGGPGHLDPRRNDGCSAGSQGIVEDPAWEPQVFGLFDQLRTHPEGVLLGICHTFGIMCRWLGVADAHLRGPEKGGKSAGIMENALTPAAREHPWFRYLSTQAGPSQRIAVLDSRLYDLLPAGPLPAHMQAIGYETIGVGGPVGPALTMLEVARDVADGMPRILGVNHHPEIVNRPRQLSLLRRRHAAGKIDDTWYEERRRTLMETLDDRAGEQQLALTSSFSLHGPLRYHLGRRLRRAAERLGRPWPLHERTTPLAMLATGEVLSLDELGAAL
ncbi:hypothetical protein [Luteitalea sp. TBR-22]|uniref:hypothetical protein n=1 Tax=Luteitalea sp. TBR-22 TaxID=2802971 RepID=UPI001AF2DE9F|nr:hypothetical protein [Luteitalea sp. TBR-22]